MLIVAAIGLRGAWYVYQRYQYRIHTFVEANPPLRDFRNYIRLWPPPKNFLDCEPIAESPVPRFEAPTAVAQGKLFVFGGFIDRSLHASIRSDVYDPIENTWREIASLPAKVTHVSVAVGDGVVWVAGGFAGDHPGQAISDVWIYNIENDDWTPSVALPGPRAAGGLVLLDGTLHYFGGSLEDRQTDSPSHWTLDTQLPDVWRPAAEFPTPRQHFSYAGLGGKIYAIGGQRNHDRMGADVDRVDVYDPATDSWTSAAPLARKRSHSEPGTFIWQDQVCIAGGEGGFVQALYDVDCYDPASDSWQAAPALPDPIRAPILRPLGDGWILSTGGTMPDGMMPTAQTRMCTAPLLPHTEKLP